MEESMKQGDNYSPEGNENEDDESISSENEDTPIIQSNPNVTDVGEKKKTLMAAAVVAIALVLLVIAVIISCVINNKKAKEEQRRAEELLQEELEEVFEYTNAQVEALRNAGYTGKEIETFEYEEQDFDSLIKSAEAARKQIMEKEILPYFDNASEEFKELYANTWIGQKELKYDTSEEGYTRHSTTINVDYEKLPARGHQLFIKYYLKNGDACFMYITPKRYAELNDSGNIVLRIEYIQTADKKQIVVSAEEVIP